MGEENKEKKEKVGQEQIHDLLFGEKLSWQSIIYDLINTEQLDPWDVDISLLSNKYLGKIKDLEIHNFFISSKVLLAAALLLRIKSEILLNYELKSLDDILFGRNKEEKKYTQERIDLDEDIPELVPRTPLPRFRKVSLQELMTALGKAIKTETRRIKRVVVQRQQEIETSLSLPKKRININDRIRTAYDRLRGMFKERDKEISYTEFAGVDKESRRENFAPLLHLDNQHKIWLEQEGHFEEIWIMLKEMYEKKNKETLDKMRKEADEAFLEANKELSEEDKKDALDIKHSFDNPIGSSI